ncbi:hypothetical protein [Geothrix campi]|jgi:hypothetical protein|uniref:hypothetical protein n=1 Tax=Geothrix campi TaxID=2966450 RepID=UPI002148DD15|nr:hypothetical protein [Geothrix sp. SG10]
MTSQEMEKAAIEQSYISTVANIFDNFVGGYTATNTPERQEAVKQDFREKILHIRLMKDLAIASIPA